MAASTEEQLRLICFAKFCDDFFRVVRHAFDVLRHWLLRANGGAAQHLQFDHSLERFSRGFFRRVRGDLRLAARRGSLAALFLVNGAKNQVSRRIFPPVIEQVDRVAHAHRVDLLKCPSGNGDLGPVKKGPVYCTTTGRASPGLTSFMPLARCTASIASTNVLRSSKSSKSSSFMSG
jgi:hypothetical protein